MIQPTGVEYLRVAPEIVLTVCGALMMLVESVTSGPAASKTRGFGWAALSSLVLAAAATFLAAGEPGLAFSGMIRVDEYATFFRLLSLAVGTLTVLFSFAYLDREGAEGCEYYVLVLFSLVGQSFMAASNDLIMVFLGIEISSIATYVLAGYLRGDKRSSEAALKYFLLGSFATAFLLYGVAWVYGTVQSTRLDTIRDVLSNPSASPSPLVIAMAISLLLVGLAFKVSAFPFQIWVPDVYQGSGAPVTAFMSAAPKAAAFAVLVRIVCFGFSPVNSQWEPMFWVMALLTMLVGNFGALAQTNIKRMFAYSSVAHAGYVLVAVTAAMASRDAGGITAVLFYLASYAAMNVGAFAVIGYVARKGEEFVSIDDFAGLGWSRPAVGAAFVVLLLSFIGVPLTGGFLGKFYVFKAALDSNLVWLAVLGLLNSAVAAYYYVRILVVMYMREPGESMKTLEPIGPGAGSAVWISVAATLGLGIFPATIFNLAKTSSLLIK